MAAMRTAADAAAATPPCAATAQIMMRRPLKRQNFRRLPH